MYYPPVPQLVHVNHASKDAVWRWQRNQRKEIKRLEKKGYTLVELDEAFIRWEVGHGRKYWSPVGSRILMPYNGKHRYVTVYGAIARDGRQTFMTADRFNSDTFIEFLGELCPNDEKVAVIMDGASVHKSRKVMEHLEDHPNIKVIYLPKGSPYLNCVEQCWNKTKHDLLVSENYETFEDMKETLSKYLEMTEFDHDIEKYIYKSPAKILKKFKLKPLYQL